MVQQHSRFYCIQSVSTILIPQPIPHPTEIIKIVGVRCTSPDNTLYSHTIFPAFISSFPSYSEKNIYLCHTLSAHQRDETGKSGFLFLNGVNNVLFPKSKLSKFHAPGNDTTDTPHRWSYINISIRDLLYINVWRGCLLFIIIWWRVLLSLKFR